MMSRYHGSKSFGSQESFLTETAIYTVKRWKKSMGYHFVPESSQAQESHTKMSIFSFFFLPYFQDHGLLRPRYFAIIMDT